MGNRQLKRAKLHEILACRLHGKSIRETRRITGASRNTIAKWGNAELIEAIRMLRPQCVPVPSEPPLREIFPALDDGRA